MIHEIELEHRDDALSALRRHLSSAHAFYEVDQRYKELSKIHAEKHTILDHGEQVAFREEPYEQFGSFDYERYQALAEDMSPKQAMAQAAMEFERARQDASTDGDANPLPQRRPHLVMRYSPVGYGHLSDRDMMAVQLTVQEWRLLTDFLSEETAEHVGCTLAPIQDKIQDTLAENGWPG
jgi:hypothetical protein